METAFDHELKHMFLNEASRRLVEIVHCVLALRDTPRSPTAPARARHVIRLTHELKGNAFASGFDQLGELLDEFERNLIKVQTEAALEDAPRIDALLAHNDRLLATVAQLRGGAA